MKRLKGFFENISFRGKVSFIIIATSAVVLILSGFFMVMSDLQYISRSLQERMVSIARVIGENCSAALIFNDKEEARRILSTLKAEKDVVEVYLFDEEMEPFASYTRTGYSTLMPQELLKYTQGKSFYKHSSNIYIKQDVIYDNEKLGTIVLGYSTVLLKEKLTWYLGIGALIMVVALLAAAVISSKLQDIVVGPVYELIEKMNEITRNKDYSIRVQKKSSDEIGQLIEHFNQMLEEVYKRDRQLQEHKENLELLVKERTEELERAKDEAMILAQKAQSASLAKSIFLANMSHELRTPLNSIIGFAEILLDKHYGPLNQQQEEFLHDILSSARHLLSLINDILDLTKIEAGHMKLEPSEVNVVEIVQKSTALLKEKTLKHGIKVELTVDPSVPEYIVADGKKLKQVMFNLLSNAAKFTPSGGSINIDISVVSYDWINGNIAEEFRNELSTIEPYRGKKFLTIAVKDTGVGIKRENLRVIFEPFRQEENSLKKGQPGTGLGLALTREIIRLHDGIIWAESDEGRGAVFTFVLPIKDHPEY